MTAMDKKAVHPGLICLVLGQASQLTDPRARFSKVVRQKNSEQEKKSEAGLIRIFILGTSFHRLPCLLSICCIFDFPIIPLLGQGSEERKTTRVRESGPLVTPSNYGSEEGKEATTLTKRRATERTNHGFGIPMQAERVSPPD